MDSNADAMTVLMSSFWQMTLQTGLGAKGEPITELCSRILVLTQIVHSVQHFWSTMYVPGIVFSPRHSIAIETLMVYSGEQVGKLMRPCDKRNPSV